MSAPLLAAAERADHCYSVKDPAIVRHNGRWHLFCTIRSKIRSHQIEYLSFKDWPEAAAAQRHILTIFSSRPRSRAGATQSATVS
jgi:hypothetical protein